MQLLRWLDEDLGGGCQNPKGFGPRVPGTQREAALAALCSQVFTYLSLWVGSSLHNHRCCLLEHLFLQKFVFEITAFPHLINRVRPILRPYVKKKKVCKQKARDLASSIEEKRYVK
jgi:hypothetical protein